MNDGSLAVQDHWMWEILKGWQIWYPTLGLNNPMSEVDTNQLL